MNHSGVLTCCAVCKTETSRRCSRCLDTYYCNRDHQREDWKRHKTECLPKVPEQGPPRRDKVVAHDDTPQKVVNSVADSVNTPNESVLINNRNRISIKHKSKLVEKGESAAVSNGKQTSQTVNESAKQTIRNGIISSENSVNKIAELSLLKDSEVKSSVVYSKDLSKDSAITYEGSSEQEILSESAQQLNNVEFVEPATVAPSVLNKKSETGDKMPVVPSYIPEPAPRLGHKEYPEASLKTNQYPPNYLLDSADPSYEICQRVIRDMTQYGVCVLDNFLGRDRGLLVLKEVLDMYRSGIFTAGQLVSNTGSTEAQTIRSDRITWLDGKEPQCKFIGTLINQVDSIILKANKMQSNGKLGDYIINGRTKAMVACYPGSGSHYVKHVDNPNKDGRCITAIYYLNLDWDCSRNGGLLRVFPEGTDTVANIQPIFDRMLFFWSDRRNPHEVQPAYATRYAITLWYFDSQEREEALRLYKSRDTRASSSK